MSRHGWVRSACLVAFLAILPDGLPAAAAAAPNRDDVPPLPMAVRAAMQDQNFAEAVKVVDAALAAPDAAKDYLTYFKGRALYLSRDYDAAVAAFDRVGAEFPKSEWTCHARFAKAMALARKGDYRAAEAIVRAEAEYLLSPERKQQIAAIYLEFADAHFKPPKDEQKPDYAKAQEYYLKALEAGPGAEKKVEVELLVAQCKQQLGDHAGAAALYEQFIKDQTAGPLEIEARFRLGECRMAAGDAKAARRAWQDLLAKYIDDRSDRMAEAQYNLAHTWLGPNRVSDEALSLGVAALEKFLESFPAHKLAGKAHLEIAAAYTANTRYDDAAKSLRRFLTNDRYKQLAEIADARNLLGQSLQRQKKFTEALAVWQDFLVKHPAHPAWSDVQREIITTEYVMADERLEVKDYDAARKLFREFLSRYPLEGRNPKVLLRVARTWREQEKWDEAIAEWRRVVSKYPQSDEASFAQYCIGETLETKLGKLDEALEQYRKVTWGASASDALLAASRLTEKTMTVATERIFRSDETPKLKLTTRNIESVTVRAYKVDLETYFRKMHKTDGVEGLDIALIDPDKTFEYTIPAYTKHQQVENAIEVPMPSGAKAGVLAVTVSSKTLEATTLIVQSDLDLIVKSSRDELFVFAENMRTGKPCEGARLLVSNGKQVFAEEKTGKDGVLQKSFAELKESGDVRVFAVADGNVASNLVNLSGVGTAQGLADKGYIYTDRPAYRAGDLVHVRGWIRHAATDAYVVEKGKKFFVDVFDPRNRLLQQSEVRLGEFGGFALHFDLPVACPQGQCRIAVRDEAGKQTYQGGFTVNEYRLEPVQLTVDLPRTVYCRGEEIEGVIRAAYYYGAPLAGREIRYQLADDRQYTATTDAKGEVRFKLPTREFSETRLLVLQVSLAERNLSKAVNLVLAQHGFSIGLSTVRPVFVAGETFEVKLSTRDAEGKPIGQKLAIKVFEQTTVEGKVGERLLEEHAIETAAADGIARKTLKLPKGGQYIVRAEGLDRFQNAVFGQTQVQISDEQDNVRLRILADAHTFRVGDTAKVALHWREKPALGLITFQGAKVLEYRLIELKTGENRLDIPLTAQLAPNFELAAAVMTDPRGEKVASDKKLAADKRPIVRFHEATSPFTVERDLKVALALKRKGAGAGPIQPGEEVEVAIATTDAQGKPVAAELSLTMVEQSLLDRFGWQVGAVQDFFRGTARQSAIRTSSSITFAYQPQTRAINPRLLAEAERLEIAKAEEESRGKGIGRETSSLLTMVTPKIVIQEEEDEKLGIVETSEAPTELNIESLTLDGDGIAMTEQPDGTLAPAKNGHASARFGGAKSYKSRSRSGGGLAGYGYAGTARRDGRNAWGYDLSRTSPVTGWQIQALAAKDRQVVVLDKSGSMGYVQMSALVGGEVTLSEQTLKALEAALNKSGAVLLPMLAAQETGYWNPAIVTDKDGKAVVTLTMPERSTAWKLLAKGITADTLCGEASDGVAVKKPLFGQLKLPLSFTDGDEAEILATVHNSVLDKGPVEVTLKTTIAGRSVEEKKTLDFTTQGIQDIAFKTALVRPEVAKDAAAGEPVETDILFELTVVAGDHREVTRQVVPLLPFGMPVFAAASGSATADTSAWVEPPKDMPLARTGMQIFIGPSVERSLMDILFGPVAWCRLDTARFTSGHDAATSDLMAAVALQKLLGTAREAAGPEAQALDGRVRSSVSLLVSSQNDDGGWSWSGRGGTSDRYATARAAWALALAKKAGYGMGDEGLAKALAFLQNQLTATAEADYESKAILLHALAVAGQGDFALANRLHRNRPSLSSAALAHLALAFAAMDRKATAEDILGVLSERKLDGDAGRRKSAQGSLPWSHSPAELRALYCLALQEANSKSPKTKELADWLLANRAGNRWTPDKATGPAALALCRWFAESRFEGERYKLRVLVNDNEVKLLDIDPKSGTQVLDVPAGLLKPGAKQRVSFQITGRGRYTWQCLLGGFVPADKLVKTTDDWRVERTWQPAPLEFDGREIPRGFAGLEGGYTTFRNPLTQLAVGRRSLVDIEIWRNHPGNTPPEQLEYLVVTEPIPCGTTVIEKSVQGDFERFEINPGSITFYVGQRPHGQAIHYDLYGYLPGKYRTAPTVVRSVYRPEQLAVSKPLELKVLPQGEKSTDEYRLTPQELYELGKLHFAKKDMPAAQQHLGELLAKWNTAPEVYKHAVQMLLDAHLEIGPPAQVVRYFEIVKEKWPSEEIPFAKIVRVGAAYESMGEFERSYLIFRATVEGNLSRESRVAGFLESQGEFLRSVDVMGKLLREYPPEGFTAAAAYALAQRVYAKAPEAAADANLRKQRINRVDLTRRAWCMLESFLTAYPDDPAADQAAFAAANALLELKAYPEAIAACKEYAKRYPKSELVDSFWYMVGYCDFATGKHDDAILMCRKVAEAKRIDKATGVEKESDNKDRAIFILGQVYHSLGRAAEAIAEYRRVESQFSDAKEAIDYFLRKAIELPEVSTVKPGAAAEVELKFRNIAACDAKVYRIDLMKFSLLNRNLGGITHINLSGIRPYHEAKVPLGDGKDYRDRTHKLALPLKEEGAYLVVCRGDDLHASGLVLVSPLTVEVQEDAASGRVRTTVKDQTADKYLSGVHVKVIGSRNDDFVAGATDLRGVHLADGIRGMSTVIAQADGSRYAFFRGELDLGPEPAKLDENAEANKPAAASNASPESQLLEGLQDKNNRNQGMQVEQLKQMYQKDQKGVEAQKAF